MLTSFLNSEENNNRFYTFTVINNLAICWISKLSCLRWSQLWLHTFAMTKAKILYTTMSLVIKTAEESITLNFKTNWILVSHRIPHTYFIFWKGYYFYSLSISNFGQQGNPIMFSRCYWTSKKARKHSIQGYLNLIYNTSMQTNSESGTH